MHSKWPQKVKNLNLRKNLTKEKLSLYKSKASKTFQTPSQLQTQPDRAQKSSKRPPKTKEKSQKKYKEYEIFQMSIPQKSSWAPTQAQN